MARPFIPLNIYVEPEIYHRLMDEAGKGNISRFVRELLEEHFAKTEKANAVGQGQEINS